MLIFLIFACFIEPAIHLLFPISLCPLILYLTLALYLFTSRSQSDPDDLKRLFTTYVDKYNYETLMHLQVVGIAFEKSVTPTPADGSGPGMPNPAGTDGTQGIKGMVPVIRIRCE
jgi:hypothetical protein